MKKQTIEKVLPTALEALQSPECKICNNGSIPRAYRSQISAFGSAVTMGSFRAAVAFYSEDVEGRGVSRSELIRAIYYVAHKSDALGDVRQEDCWLDAKDVVKKVLNLNERDVRAERDRFLHAAVALKLAMNAFNLTK